MTAIQNCGFQPLEHPAYSSDLAPSDYHLFPKLKKDLSGRQFGMNNDVTDPMNQFLRVQDTDFYKAGICMFHDCWSKCVHRPDRQTHTHTDIEFYFNKNTTIKF